jgi:hypothetical protein
MSDLSFTDRACVEWAVRRVDFELDGRVPWRKRKQIRDELRGNLLAAAADAGAKDAVRQLGDLHVLAVSYLDLYRGRFDFQAGSWAAVITYGALAVLGLVAWFAFASGVMASGGHAASYLFGPFAGSISGNRMQFVFFSPAHALLMALAFVIGSSYRLVLRRRSRRN